MTTDISRDFSYRLLKGQKLQDIVKHYFDDKIFTIPVSVSKKQDRTKTCHEKQSQLKDEELVQSIISTMNNSTVKTPAQILADTDIPSSLVLFKIFVKRYKGNLKIFDTREVRFLFFYFAAQVKEVNDWLKFWISTFNLGKFKVTVMIALAKNIDALKFISQTNIKKEIVTENDLQAFDEEIRPLNIQDYRTNLEKFGYYHL